MFIIDCILYLFFFSSRRRHTICALVTGVQTCALPISLETGSPWDLSTDPRYAGIDIPLAESLKDTIERVLPYYEAAIVPELAAGKTVLISAHGRSEESRVGEE